MLFDPIEDQNRFSEYFHPLVEIAKDGLVGTSPNPKIASGALMNFQSEVTTREAGRVKHRYMKRLAWYTGINAFLGLAIGLFFLYFAVKWPTPDLKEIFDPKAVGCFFLVLSGCSAGVWLSFGARRQTLGFFDLHIPEPDRMHPAMRVAFVMALTVIVSLLAHLQLITFGIGDIKMEHVFMRPDLAWLIGALCGFSEQLMSTQVSQQAARLLPNKPK